MPEYAYTVTMLPVLGMDADEYTVYGDDGDVWDLVADIATDYGFDGFEITDDNHAVGWFDWMPDAEIVRYATIARIA